MTEQESAVGGIAAADASTRSLHPRDANVAWNGQPLKRNAAAESVGLPAPFASPGSRPRLGWLLAAE